MWMDTKKILWANLQALMMQKFGEVNLYKTVKLSKSSNMPISLGSLQRIKSQETAVGLEVIDKIAIFFELQPWQLLIENLDPSNPPIFILDKKQQEFFNRMTNAYKDLVSQ